MAGQLYVILRHEGIAKPHFDLMFQTAPGSALATWRAENWPPINGMAVERLADHRQAYLTFEGALSGDRGHVSRVEQGICDIERIKDRWTIRLRALPGGEQKALEINQIRDATWQCTAP